MTETIRVFRYTLDPTPTQSRALLMHCGAVRFAYNHMLAVVVANMRQRDAERSYGIHDTDLTPSLSWSAYSLRRELNTRKNTVAPWWGEVSKEAFASGTANLASALARWRSSTNGALAGRKVGFPTFHGRRHRRSCTFTTGTIRVEPDRHHVTLPRVGAIHTAESTRSLSRRVQAGTARVTRATVSLHRGRWVVSLLARVTTTTPTHRRPGTVVGVDVGVKDWLVAATPDGTEVLRVPCPPQVVALADRQARLQRRHRRKVGPDRRTGQVASARWCKARRQVDKLGWRIANLREDTIRKATTTLARDYETIVVETLTVAGMAARGGSRKRGLNRAISRAAMGQVRPELAYKTAREGGYLVAVDRFYPSSKTCSECGHVKTKLALSERTYGCTHCGAVIGRDLNAAVNLARKATTDGSTPVVRRGAIHKTSHPRVVGAEGDETLTQPAHQAERESPADNARVHAR